MYVWSNVGTNIIFLWYYLRICVENFMFFIQIGYEYLVTILCSIPFRYIYCTMQESSYLGKIVLVSIWSRMGLVQIIDHVYKDILTLTYLPNINIRMVLQFGYPSVHSFNTINDVDWYYSCITCITVQRLHLNFLCIGVLIDMRCIEK